MRLAVSNVSLVRFLLEILDVRVVLLVSLLPPLVLQAVELVPVEWRRIQWEPNANYVQLEHFLRMKAHAKTVLKMKYLLDPVLARVWYVEQEVKLTKMQRIAIFALLELIHLETKYVSPALPVKSARRMVQSHARNVLLVLSPILTRQIVYSVLLEPSQQYQQPVHLVQTEVFPHSLVHLHALLVH